MRSILFFTLLLFIAAVKCGPLPSNESTNELMKDDSQSVIPWGNHVNLTRPGTVDLVISSDSLIVGVDIQGCKGTVLFCYNSSKPDVDAEKLCPDLPGFCGFRFIGTEDNKITFTTGEFKKDDLKECLNDIKMKWASTEYCKHVTPASCNAALSNDNPITIRVDRVSSQCPVTIKYAKLYVPPTTTTTIPSTAFTSITTQSNGTIAKNDDKTSEASSEMWTWIVLGCVIGLIVLGLIGGIFLCWFNDWCMFKKKTGENLPPLHPVKSIVSATVEAKAEEKIEKAYEKIKADYPELKEVISKKSKKAQPAPPPPSAEQVKKSPPPALGKSAKKEKKAKTPPPPPVAAAPSKNAPKEKKPAPASPGKKSVGKKAAVPSAEKKSVEKKAASSKETTEKPCSSTQSYSPEFCILAVRTPSPPRQPVDPEVLRERRRRRKENDSLELYAAEREKQFKADCAANKKRHNWM